MTMRVMMVLWTYERKDRGGPLLSTNCKKKNEQTKNDICGKIVSPRAKDTEEDGRRRTLSAACLVWRKRVLRGVGEGRFLGFRDRRGIGVTRAGPAFTRVWCRPSTVLSNSEREREGKSGRVEARLGWITEPFQDRLSCSRSRTIRHSFFVFFFLLRATWRTLSLSLSLSISAFLRGALPEHDELDFCLDDELILFYFISLCFVHRLKKNSYIHLFFL